MALEKIVFSKLIKIKILHKYQYLDNIENYSKK